MAQTKRLGKKTALAGRSQTDRYIIGNNKTGTALKQQSANEDSRLQIDDDSESYEPIS